MGTGSSESTMTGVWSVLGLCYIAMHLHVQYSLYMTVLMMHVSLLKDHRSGALFDPVGLVVSGAFTNSPYWTRLLYQ